MCEKNLNQENFDNQIEVFAEYINSKQANLMADRFLSKESKKSWNYFKGVSKYSSGKSCWNGTIKKDKDITLHANEALNSLLDHMKQLGLIKINKKNFSLNIPEEDIKKLIELQLFYDFNMHISYDKAASYDLISDNILIPQNDINYENIRIHWNKD